MKKKKRTAAKKATQKNKKSRKTVRTKAKRSSKKKSSAPKRKASKKAVRAKAKKTAKKTPKISVTPKTKKKAEAVVATFAAVETTRTSVLRKPDVKEEKPVWAEAPDAEYTEESDDEVAADSVLDDSDELEEFTDLVDPDEDEM